MQQYPLPASPKFTVDDDGSNAPIFHQRAIARLTARMYPLFESGVIPFEPLPETMVGEYNSPTPDVILYENSTEQTPVIIEVCRTRGVKADLDKVVRLVDNDLYGILEGFVYNYTTQHWLRYRKGDGGQATESSFSDVLNLDLNAFL